MLQRLLLAPVLRIAVQMERQSGYGLRQDPDKEYTAVSCMADCSVTAFPAVVPPRKKRNPLPFVAFWGLSLERNRLVKMLK